MVRNIVFDVAGVLAEWDPKAWFTARYGEELGLRLLNAAVHSPDWWETDSGLITEEEFFRRQREENPGLARELEDVEKNWHTILRPSADTEDLVRRLKKAGYQVYYLSNFPERTFLWLADYAPVFGLMDGGVVSYDVHQLKPNADIFRTFLSRYDLKAEETVFTDDTLVNAEGAKRVGLYAWHFTGAAGFEKYLREELGLQF